ncbi:TetR/AcrR family transcriptional regulator [Allokutzneria sp. A3M-2-11 16]|uniref:TetR family transcriptional regulator n=1 Tax=Allokutzneria sp. A3M-2-11 16 TaxID=2962043 RepID=UPI0020B64705|nr:TetR family transcriptional regulator [Allokutzneria sp. A3M-2-11 16]MCP3802613.1 TetR/AcrR family transcriptional regulator [Allokutzneria sp. A3M-2-11 16]
MDEPTGLRERKKQRTREAISNAAIALFFEHGFDQVSISRIAQVAEVSRRTLFAYFPAKEDLVLHRIADHETESARIVRDHPGAPLAALRAHFMDGLDRRDPITGLCDVPAAVALYRLIMGTPSLAAGMLRYRGSSEVALAEALRERAPELTARLAAAQIMAVQWRLAEDNQQLIADGTSADDAYPAAVDAARQGFELLSKGLESILGTD